MTNVNVPFGTVNWMSRGQEENKGRRGIIYFISCWTRTAEEESWRASIVNNYMCKNEITISSCCFFCDIWGTRWILHPGSAPDDICVGNSELRIEKVIQAIVSVMIRGFFGSLNASQPYKRFLLRYVHDLRFIWLPWWYHHRAGSLSPEA